MFSHAVVIKVPQFSSHGLNSKFIDCENYCASQIMRPDSKRNTMSNKLQCVCEALDAKCTLFIIEFNMSKGKDTSIVCVGGT